MKKFLLFILIFLITLKVNANVLEAGISIEEIPKPLFGEWRVFG